MRNRETADGGAGSISACGGNGGAGGGAGGGVGVEAGFADAVTLVEDGLPGEDVPGPDGDDCMPSTLGRGELVLAMPGGGVLTGRTEDSKCFGFASDDGAGFPRRPKNDNKPPPVFFLLSVAGVGSSFSIILQPGGKRSSFKTSGLDFTEVSHAVDPFEAIYKAIGLDRTVSMCRVSRRASFMCFEVKVFENCTCWGRVKSCGISRSITSLLLEEI